jgi:hypothetical protein
VTMATKIGGGGTLFVRLFRRAIPLMASPGRGGVNLKKLPF